MKLLSPEAVLSVDPGLWKSGCAVWAEDGTLLSAWTEKHAVGDGGPVTWRAMAQAIQRKTPSVKVVVCQVMQMDSRSKGKEKALLQLSGVVGAVAVAYSEAEVLAFAPREWKGSVPKHVCHKRLQERLTDSEMGRLSDKCLTHDAWDAIGIGAYYFRTLGIPRWQLKRGM